MSLWRTFQWNHHSLWNWERQITRMHTNACVFASREHKTPQKACKKSNLLLYAWQSSAFTAGWPLIVTNGTWTRAWDWSQERKSRAWRLEWIIERVKRMKIYLPLCFQPYLGWKGSRCADVDSWPGNSLVEFSKYFVAISDLETQHLKYLYLTKRPQVTLE